MSIRKNSTTNVSNVRSIFILTFFVITFITFYNLSVFDGIFDSFVEVPIDRISKYYPDTIANTKYLGLFLSSSSNNNKNLVHTNYDPSLDAAIGRIEDGLPVDSVENTKPLFFHDIYKTDFQKVFPLSARKNNTSSSSSSLNDYYTRMQFEGKALEQSRGMKAILENEHCQRTFESRRVNAEKWYRFPEDQPRAVDEAHFCHIPAKFRDETHFPLSKSVFQMPGFVASGDFGDGDGVKYLEEQFSQTVSYLYDMFKMYDSQHKKTDEKDDEEDEEDNDQKRQNQPKTPSLKVFGTMCVGTDCTFIPTMISHLKIPIGHFIVVVNTGDASTKNWRLFFSGLENQFPGRFSAFIRPQKLSCAESWNLVTRMGFAHIYPMPKEIFISNADWHPKPYKNIDNHMLKFLEYSAQHSSLVANRYFDFSSFSFTQKGYKELGYFDEVIFPALTEDVEFHLKAVSKGLGTLGNYPFGHQSSVHITRASVHDRETAKRQDRGSRFDYIHRKWGISVPSFRDFARAKPFKHPFNMKTMNHTRSWVVDLKHRHCLRTGNGKKYRQYSSSSSSSSGRSNHYHNRKCLYNLNVLKKVGFVNEKTDFVGLNDETDRFK